MQSLNPGLSDRPDRLSRFQLKHLYVAIRSERQQSLPQRILRRSTQKIGRQRQAKKSRMAPREKWRRSRQLHYNPVIKIQLQKTNFDWSCILN